MANENQSSDKHCYWANAVGFIAFCVLIMFAVKSCSSLTIEREKTRQIEIQNGVKK